MQLVDNLFSKYLSCLYREERKYLNRMLKSRGMGSSVVRFMMYIYHNQGNNQKKVCSEMGIDEGLGTRVMKKLENEQMIIRRTDPADARSHILEVTHKGEEFVIECKQMQSAFWENVTQTMHREEKEKLLSMLEALSDKAVMFNHKETDKKQKGENHGD